MTASSHPFDWHGNHFAAECDDSCTTIQYQRHSMDSLFNTATGWQGKCLCGWLAPRGFMDRDQAFSEFARLHGAMGGRPICNPRTNTFNHEYAALQNDLDQ